MVRFGRFGWAEWQRNISDHVAEIGPLSNPDSHSNVRVESFVEKPWISGKFGH